MPRTSRHHMISYADEIMAHTKGYANTQVIISHIQSSCEDLGLSISAEKTKILTRHPLKQNGTESHCAWKRYSRLSLDLSTFT